MYILPFTTHLSGGKIKTNFQKEGKEKIIEREKIKIHGKIYTTDLRETACRLVKLEERSVNKIVTRMAENAYIFR